MLQNHLGEVLETVRSQIAQLSPEPLEELVGRVASERVLGGVCGEVAETDLVSG